MSEKSSSFEMPEPVFQSTLGDEVKPWTKENNEVPVNHELAEVDLQKIWKQLGNDNELRETFSLVTLGSVDKSNSFSIDDITEFYKKFPTEDSYLKSLKNSEIFSYFQTKNPPDEYQEINQRITHLLDAMYPEE